jgi:prevent-host-death family protein
MRRKHIENMVPVTELANKASATVQKAEDGETQFIIKRNKVVAVLMDIDLYLAIAELSKVWHKDLDDGEWTDIIDYAQTVVQVRRAKESIEKGEFLDFKTLMKELSLNEEDLN